VNFWDLKIFFDKAPSLEYPTAKHPTNRGSNINKNVMANLQYFFDIYIVQFGILILQFVVPITSMFGLLYLWKNQPWKNLKIKKKYPDQKFIWHEIRLSFLTFFLLGFVITIDTILLRQNFTRGYTDIAEYGWGYLVFSVIGLLVLYDAYFYFAHRIFHIHSVYTIVHRPHHHSPAITPFAAFSISALEALVEFAFLPVMIFLIPLHPLALATFLTIYIFYNAYIHCGFELLPKFWVTAIPCKYFNSAVHHSLHHSIPKYNFGLFTNIWDRLFGTQIADYETQFLKVKEAVVVVED